MDDAAYAAGHFSVPPGKEQLRFGYLEGRVFPGEKKSSSSR
jgi:hypothetical protein